MARLAEDDDICRTDLYAELRHREEENHVRRHGRRLLSDEGLAMVDSPGPRLHGLRAGRPVEINDWQRHGGRVAAGLRTGV